MREKITQGIGEISTGAMLEDIAQLYGEDLAPAMAILAEALEPVVETVVDDFYGHLRELEGTRDLIRCLSDDELNGLKRHQTENLLQLASPGLTSEIHQSLGMRAGRMHAIIGLRRRDLAHSMEILHAAVRRFVDVSAHHAALGTLSRRMMRDLTWQIDAARDILNGYQDTLLSITELVWSASNHADLIAQATTTLGRLDGIVGCSFGRPDSEGAFRFESVSSRELDGYLSELEASKSGSITAGDAPQGRGPTGRAWKSGQVERCLNIETDPRMTPWRDIARRYGIRSSLAIPLCPPDRIPSTVLTLYSELPGGYTSPDQVGFITQVQTLLTLAFSRLENNRENSRTIPWSDRQRWASLIRTSALEMVYQPIKDLGTGAITKAEALVRLRDGDQLLAPGAFFAALSRDDFVAVYASGLDQVLAQQRRWQECGLDLQVSVNLPAEAIAEIQYFEITRNALLKHGCPPHRLELEVLERGEYSAQTDAADCLEKFLALGVSLAEDDLGSGHSSLSRLRALPFHTVKIDRSIVSGVEYHALDVLSSIYQLTELCHSLGKRVVVEGIENDELIQAISLFGADYAQGYAIARPMPAARFTEWITEYRENEGRGKKHCSGRLVELAKLLLWESHIRPILRRVQVQLFEVPASPRPALPFSSVEPVLQVALLDAAYNHGVDGSEYVIARNRLIEAIENGDQNVH
jgi:EAL domain-containing protein (putative c-di-GMP-specific phosphodiesterase class I)